MRKNILALAIFLASILYALIGIPILVFSINYREIRLDNYFTLLSVMIICLYNFGVYISATLIQLSSKRTRDIIPSALTLGSIIGSVMAYLTILMLKPYNVVTWGILLLFPLGGIRSTCIFEANKHVSRALPLLKISTVILVNLIVLIAVSKTDFPGVQAPIQIRQKWAYEEFSFYRQVVKHIGFCNPIQDKVGKIKFIAPTKGRNIHIAEGGSGDHSELTLEIVGEKGTGIAHLSGQFMPSVNFFEYQGKKTRVICVN
jgi:hypothetical protein